MNTLVSLEQNTNKTFNTALVHTETFKKMIKPTSYSIKITQRHPLRLTNRTALKHNYKDEVSTMRMLCRVWMTDLDKWRHQSGWQVIVRHRRHQFSVLWWLQWKTHQRWWLWWWTSRAKP